MQRRHRCLQILLRELALFLCAGCAAWRAQLRAAMRARRRGVNAAVIALCLHRLRQLKHVRETLALNDRALIDLGETVVLPAYQRPLAGSQLRASVGILSHLDVTVD